MTLIWDEDVESETNLYLERRRDPRSPQERDIRVSEPYAGRSFDGTTLDVSGNGMRLRLNDQCRIRPGRVINIHVGLNAFGRSLANRRSVIDARVVWVRPDEEAPGGIIAGVELLVNVNASAA